MFVEYFKLLVNQLQGRYKIILIECINLWKMDNDFM